MGKKSAAPQQARSAATWVRTGARDRFDVGATPAPCIAALLHNARGVAYACQNELDKAIEDLEEAAALSPFLCDAHANLGSTLIRKEAPEGARIAYKKALALCPTNGLVFNGRGCAAFGDGDIEGAAI